MWQLSTKLAGTAVLCRMYNEDVVNVHQEEVKPNDEAIYGRGRPLPLFRSAASKVMLAHLPQVKVRKIYERHAAQPDSQAIGPTWDGFGAALKKIQQKGFYVSIGEVNPKTVGIAAPITLPKVGVVAVLSLVLPADRLSLINLDGIGEDVKSKTRDTSRQLEALTEAAETQSHGAPQAPQPTSCLAAGGARLAAVAAKLRGLCCRITSLREVNDMQTQKPDAPAALSLRNLSN